MKDTLLPIIYLIFGLTVATAQDPAYEWLFTGGNPSMTEGITSVMHAGNGSFYCAGIFSGNATIGDTAISSVGAKDIFIAFFQEGGNPEWIRTFGGPDDDFVRGIHKGPDGSVYLTGSFNTSLFMGSFTLLSSGGQDLFVSRLTTKPITF